VVSYLTSVYFEGGRESSEPSQESELSRASAVVEVPSAVAENGGASSPGSVPLRELSPTFRNSTFLVAIRRAGFYCDDVVGAQETGEDIWIANCADARAYLLSARLTDSLSVEPLYYDAPRSSPPVRLEFPR
jgi:hypothetical protein